MRRTLYALLIGINNYASPQISDLGGCIHDVKSIEQFLQDQFEISPGGIVTLLDDQATHQAIKETFRSHLIGNARSWNPTERGDIAPAFLFHYSGHGSHALDATGTKPNGLDETIVPHDSRMEGIYDIKDWEIGEMLDELTRYSDNVTVILDCCHSGSDTRDLDVTDILVRHCEPDMRPQPTQRPPISASTRSLATESGWAWGEHYVLLAACQDREKAYEYQASEGKTTRQHGALTYFLLEELARMSSSRPLTYRELYQRVRYAVNSRYKAQTPQCEGDRDRIVFDGLRPRPDRLLSIVEKSKGYIWVNGGVAHGLTEGSLLHVYAPELCALSDVEEVLATITVEEVGAVRSGCLVLEGDAEIPLHSRVAVYQYTRDMRRPVVLENIATHNVAVALKQRLEAADMQPYVVLKSDKNVQFRVTQVERQLSILDRSGSPLVSPFSLDDVDGLARDLAHIVRYRNAADLKNAVIDGELCGAVRIQLKQLEFDPETQELIAKPIVTNGSELTIETGQRIVLEVTNHSEQDLYVSIFDFSYDWSITQLYPRMRGMHERLTAGRTLSLGLSRKRREQLLLQLPEGITEVRGMVKVIATVEETDFELLEQGALRTPYEARKTVTRGEQRSPLANLLDMAMTGTTRNLFQAPSASTEDEWTTDEIYFRLIQPVLSL